MYNMTPQAQAGGTISSPSTLAYLRRVYSYFSGGIAAAIAGALIALYAGAPVEVADGVAVPPDKKQQTVKITGGMESEVDGRNKKRRELHAAGEK